MQLILDSDNIDIERNMSTIEQEPLNEKFLTNKVIDQLADDITNGNKENIQKQDNIIPDLVGDNVIDTDKEITPSGDEILAIKSSEEKTKENTVNRENVPTSDEITEDDNIKVNLKQESDTLITENLGKEGSPVKDDDVKLEKLSNIKDVSTNELKEENETDLVTFNINDTNPNKVNPVIVEKSEVLELATEINEVNENDLDKEVDISELSTELNEEKERDLDKEVDITDEHIEQVEGDNIEIKDTTLTVTEKELEKEIDPNAPNTCLDDKTEDMECSEIEATAINDMNDKNVAIEIDDEEEKSNEINAVFDEIILDIKENVDEKIEAESVEKLDTSSREETTTENVPEESAQPKRICRLSNNLDIFSDEEDDQPDVPENNVQPSTEKQCINIDDDDDIMLIDEESSAKDTKTKDTGIEVDTDSHTNITEPEPEANEQPNNDINPIIETKQNTETTEETSPNKKENKQIKELLNDTAAVPVVETNNMAVDKHEIQEKAKKPLLPKNFINTCKKNLSDMTRNDLEEFCILKIVESIVDRSNLGEIKAHLKNLTQTMEECKKKCLMLSKQNKDLQVVLKSVQEEQKSGSDVHITPLKITRSVGMQVVMVADKNNLRKKSINGSQAPIPVTNTKQVKNQQNSNTKNHKEKVNQQIPVPRLVPATSPVVKTNPTTANNAATKQVNNTALPNGVRNSPPVQKIAEKRPRSQAVTVDLTDDEPPAKLQNVQRGPVSQQMRVLTTGPNIIPASRFTQSISSPRKVYIPISGPQAQNVRPGQTIMLKTVSGLGPRPRAPTQALIAKSPQTPSPVRLGRGQLNRHPAPLPDAMKQYQPPNWKLLPPAPDLKLSKVENGIVISWKIDGYQEENHEEIASYQLYAYQETSSPPNTALWKKIGDVKALPLPMACTLTQFMAGYKYYFAVRAVDVRSRFGPFSLPGSILLLNKM